MYSQAGHGFRDTIQKNPPFSVDRWIEIDILCSTIVDAAVARAGTERPPYRVDCERLQLNESRPVSEDSSQAIAHTFCAPELNERGGCGIGRQTVNAAAHPMTVSLSGSVY